MTRGIAAAIGALGFLGLTGLLAAAQAPPATPAVEVTPGVSMAVSGSSGGGSTGSIVLSTKDWYESLMFVGDTGDRNICIGGTTGPRTGQAVLPDGVRPVLTWRVAVRLRTFDGATAVIDVRWRRDVEGADIQPASDIEGAFTWRASEGERHVLDFVRQTPPAQPGCDTQSVELTYTAHGPDELREAAISYDVWLLQRFPSGERRTQRLHSTGVQGAPVTFAFPTIGLEMPATDGSGPTIIDLRVDGAVIGRVRRDGRIDLVVNAGRVAGKNGLQSGNSGQTRLTVAQNETVELEPPPLYGDNDGPYAELFRDARTAIRVRAKRLW